MRFPLPSEPEPYEIKKQAPFNIALSLIFPNDEAAEEVERGIRFAVRYFPEQGIDTGRSAPTPIYAWLIAKTECHPPLVVYYCIMPPRSVLLLTVRVTDEEE